MNELEVIEKLYQMDMKMDKGHLALLADIEALANEIADYQYHDFKNSEYSAPKHALIKRLEKLIENVKTGKYDN